MSLSPPGPLQGQNILVTGATGGIGQALVTRIAALGAHPIIHFVHNAEAARDLVSRIDGRGTLVQADLAAPTGATRLWNEALERRGRVHALVNNAGIRTATRVEDDLDAWQAAWAIDMRVNLLAPADLCRLAIPHFRKFGGGRIINIASRAAQRGCTEDHMPYGAAKAGLISLTKSIARSFGKDGVIATAIAPGFVHTAMATEFIEERGLDAAIHDIPIAEMVTPSELADLIAFLLDPRQRSINGATLDVNGGSFMR